MTREELRDHCERQIEVCKKWARIKGEKPSGEVYEEHKLILELLDYDSILSKIEEELMDTDAYELEVNGKSEFHRGVKYCLNVLNRMKRRYKA